ncbi:MAG: tetratricopeptide repeat protein [Planctomycetota bacterium]|jgi:tetratricopeptide (TPR) repeat protein
MTEDRIKNLLQEADRTAGQPAQVSVNLSTVRRRANRRRLVSFAAPITAAAVVLIATGIWNLTTRTAETTLEQDKIASLETQIKQLQARTDAALNLIHEVLEDERRQRRLDVLEAQLTSIPDPLEEMQKQVDKTAFILVYQADRSYRELNQMDSAVEAYNRVIELFPKNRWAQVARQRLSEIEKQKI